MDQIFSWKVPCTDRRALAIDVWTHVSEATRIETTLATRSLPPRPLNHRVVLDRIVIDPRRLS
jgi:hypothetical protein